MYVTENINRHYHGCGSVLTTYKLARTTNWQGRQTGPVVPRKKRLCKFCPLNKIDDGIRFLMTCTFQSDDKNALFKITYPLLGNKDYSEKCTIFKIIMSSIYISFKKNHEEIPTWLFPSICYTYRIYAISRFYDFSWDLRFFFTA